MSSLPCNFREILAPLIEKIAKGAGGETNDKRQLPQHLSLNWQQCNGTRYFGALNGSDPLRRRRRNRHLLGGIGADVLDGGNPERTYSIGGPDSDTLSGGFGL